MDAPARPVEAGEDTARADGVALADSADTRVTRYQPLVIVFMAVAAGAVCDRFLLPPADHIGNTILLARSLQLIGIATVALIVWWLAWRQQRLRWSAGLLLIAAGSAGAAWHHLHWSVYDRDDAVRYAGDRPSPVCIDAIALESPRRVPATSPTPLRAIPAGERSRLRIRIDRIRDATAWRRASGECELFVEGHLLGVRTGDRLRVYGQFARNSPPLNPGEFDFAAHSRADRQLVRVWSSVPESVTAVGRSANWDISQFANSMRDRAKQLVRTLVGPERAELAAAILLGAREGLTAEETEPYLLTGTIHVLVVSGMNVAILATGLYFAMRAGWLPRRLALAIIMAVVVAYAFVAESQPPVVRAAVFAVLLCIAAWSGRRGVAINSLAGAALFVLAMNPADLFRAGPQLSFLAVGALIGVEHWFAVRRRAPADPLDELIAATRPWPIRALNRIGRSTAWILITSLVVWLVTLPLLLNQFHIASPIAVLISPVVWVIVFVTMWSGFAMLLVGWIIPPVGVLCGIVCASSLTMLEQLVHWSESLPAGHFFAPGPAWWWVLVFYLGVAGTMVTGRVWVPPRWQLAGLATWILVGLVPPLYRPLERDAMECSFLAVGHGACVVLQSPTGETLLYDAGSLGSPEFATQTIASYLWHRGIMRIDGILISHADVDHYNAVPGLIERFNIGTIYVSPMMFDGFDDVQIAAPQVLRDAIDAAGIPIREVWTGDRMKLGREVTLHILHPPRHGVLGSDNANSITVAVEHAGRRVLLPGDLESPGIEDVIAELPYDCDVLLAPHHGSRRSDPPGFAAWSTPEWVVVSGGGGDDVRPVVETYERAGARALLTNLRGMVQFSLGSGPIEMTSFRPLGM